MNLTNRRLFNTSVVGRMQHLQMARWRCAELGTPMVRAANTGLSAIIDARGQVVAQGVDGNPDAINVAGILSGDVPLEPAEAKGPIFVRWGWMFAWGVLAVGGWPWRSRSGHVLHELESHAGSWAHAFLKPGVVASPTPSGRFGLVVRWGMMKPGFALIGLLALAGCAGGEGTKPKAQTTPPSTRPVSPVASTINASKLREDAIQRLEQLAANVDAQVRANAVEAATLAPTRVRAVIERALEDNLPAVRMVAAMSVGRAKLRDLAPRVRPLLHDGEQQVRGAAIYALARNGVDVDQSQLATMLLSDASPWDSRQAVFALGDIGNRSAVALLQTALRDRLGTMPPGQQRAFQLQIAEALAKLAMTRSGAHCEPRSSRARWKISRPPRSRHRRWAIWATRSRWGNS